MKAQVLELVAENDSEWGGYQLDRALAERGIVRLHWPSIMHGLKLDGLVNATGDAQKASTRYSITEAARCYLNAAGRSGG